MAIVRTHRPVWTAEKCLSCGACRHCCAATVFPEHAEEKDTLRGRVAREVKFSKKLEGRPPCQAACPLNQDVAGYVTAMAAGDFDRALSIILETNPFPRVLGRLCHNPCQRTCVRNKLDEQIQIRALKLAAALNGRASALAPDKERSTQVTIIGAGLAGLSAAYFLRRRGYKVKVYEAEAEPGGQLRNKVPQEDLDADIDLIRSTGVEIVTGKKQDLGNLPGADAVIVAVGALQGKKVDIPAGAFGAGEAVTGKRNEVRAVAEGKRVAEEVARQLEGEKH
jgi:NADPH-dependent glutamate synthase beta subunit-like oxidoreductase